MQPDVDYSKWKGELTDCSVATLSPGGKSVQCGVCFDGRPGGLIMMRHDYCLSVWTSHCLRSQTHIRKMAARQRATELGVNNKKRTQHSLRRWMSPKMDKKSRYEETEGQEEQGVSAEKRTNTEAAEPDVVEVGAKEDTSTDTDTDKCAGAYNLVKGPFVGRTMLYTKYVIPLATSEYEKRTYMGMKAIYSKQCSKTWTVVCKKGGNTFLNCSMIREKRGGSSLLIMMKTWEAAIQRALERREKETLTLQDLADARAFAKKPDTMFEDCGLELHREVMAQIAYMTRMERVD